MKGKNLEITVLLDFYSDALTEKQREMMDLYYGQDLSLAEIAEFANISRQGVRDAIKRGEAQLFELEANIGALARFRTTQLARDELKQIYNDLTALNKRLCSSELTVLSNRIDNCAKLLSENDGEAEIVV